MFPTWSIVFRHKIFLSVFLNACADFCENVKEEIYISLGILSYIFFTGIYNVPMLLTNRILKGKINYMKEPKVFLRIRKFHPIKYFRKACSHQ